MNEKHYINGDLCPRFNTQVRKKSCLPSACQRLRKKISKKMSLASQAGDNKAVHFKSTGKPVLRQN